MIDFSHRCVASNHVRVATHPPTPPAPRGTPAPLIQPCSQTGAAHASSTACQCQCGMRPNGGGGGRAAPERGLPSAGSRGEGCWEGGPCGPSPVHNPLGELSPFPRVALTTGRHTHTYRKRLRTSGRHARGPIPACPNVMHPVALRPPPPPPVCLRGPANSRLGGPATKREATFTGPAKSARGSHRAAAPPLDFRVLPLKVQAGGGGGEPRKGRGAWTKLGRGLDAAPHPTAQACARALRARTTCRQGARATRRTVIDALATKQAAAAEFDVLLKRRWVWSSARRGEGLLDLARQERGELCMQACARTCLLMNDEVSKTRSGTRDANQNLRCQTKT